MLKCIFENGSENSMRHTSVSVVLLKDEKVLLGQRGTYKGVKMDEYGKWCLLGGFMDRGEDCYGTATREVLEESGWTVTNLRLLRVNSSPDRPKEDRQNVELVFVGDAVAQTGTSDEEVKQLCWFPLTSLPPREEIAFDHAESIYAVKEMVVDGKPLPGGFVPEVFKA